MVDKAINIPVRTKGAQKATQTITSVEKKISATTRSVKQLGRSTGFQKQTTAAQRYATAATGAATATTRAGTATTAYAAKAATATAATSRLATGFGTMVAAAKGMALAFGAIGLIRLGDEMLDTRKIAHAAGVDIKHLANIAHASATPIRITANNFLKWNEAASGLGFSTKQLTDVQIILQQQMNKTGVESKKMRSVFNSLAGMMAGTKLAADDLEALLKASPATYQVFKKGLQEIGFASIQSASDIVKLAAAGDITKEHMITAALAVKEHYSKNFKEAEVLVSDSMNNMKTSAILLLDEFESGTKTSEVFANVLHTVGGTADNLKKSLIVLGSTIGAMALGKVAASFILVAKAIATTTVSVKALTLALIKNPLTAAAVGLTASLAYITDGFGLLGDEVEATTTKLAGQTEAVEDYNIEIKKAAVVTAGTTKAIKNKTVAVNKSTTAIKTQAKTMQAASRVSIDIAKVEGRLGEVFVDRQLAMAKAAHESNKARVESKKAATQELAELDKALYDYENEIYNKKMEREKKLQENMVSGWQDVFKTLADQFKKDLGVDDWIKTPAQKTGDTIMDSIFTTAGTAVGGPIGGTIGKGISDALQWVLPKASPIDARRRGTGNKITAEAIVRPADEPLHSGPTPTVSPLPVFATPDAFKLPTSKLAAPSFDKINIAEIELIDVTTNMTTAFENQLSATEDLTSAFDESQDLLRKQNEELQRQLNLIMTQRSLEANFSESIRREIGRFKGSMPFATPTTDLGFQNNNGKGINVNIVNVVDPDMAAKSIKKGSGREAVLNVIEEDNNYVKQILN